MITEKEKGFLNSETNQAIDIVIFDYLRHKEHLSPNYVTNKLRDLTLEVPFKLKLKRFLILQKFKMISIIKK